MSSRYTAKQWREERSALNRGDPPSKCPSCKRTGFYAPREDHPEKPRKPYRACLFCGFWQDVGGDEGRATKYECHGHLGTTAPGAKTWRCPGCGLEKDTGRCRTLANRRQAASLVAGATESVTSGLHHILANGLGPRRQAVRHHLTTSHSAKAWYLMHNRRQVARTKSLNGQTIKPCIRQTL